MDVPEPSDVDFLAVLDSDDPHVDLHQGDALAHSLGIVYDRHIDALREVQVQFVSRTLQEWDPTFIPMLPVTASFSLPADCFLFLSQCEEASRAHHSFPQ